MKCKYCDGTGTTKGWISEPCAYCGGTGELPNDFFEMTKLKKCKKCGGEAVFSGVFDDLPTYRFPECMECGARAEGNRVEDSWAERAKKWNEQNTPTNEEWFNSLPTEEKAEFYAKLTLGCYKCGAKGSHNIKNCGFDYCLCSKRDFVMWLKQPHTESSSNP